MTTIDLHIHTTKSDGSLTPVQIIDEAAKNGLKVISISDHDTVGAYSDELFEYANKKGIKLVTGVEISTKYNGKSFHILGYNFDYKNEEFRAFLKKIRAVREKYLIDVDEKLRALGYVLNIEKLKKVESVTKANIALDIVENKANESKLVEVFGCVPNRGVFIESIMNSGCPAHVKKESITPIEAAKAIRMAGGKVVLAHPVVYDRKDKVSDEMIEEVVVCMKADGLEAKYIYYDKLNQRFDDINKWSEFATTHNLFETVGSDFHLDDGVKVKIGFVNENLSMDETDVFQILKNLDVK